MVCTMRGWWKILMARLVDVPIRRATEIDRRLADLDSQLAKVADAVKPSPPSPVGRGAWCVLAVCLAAIVGAAASISVVTFRVERAQRAVEAAEEEVAIFQGFADDDLEKQDAQVQLLATMIAANTAATGDERDALDEMTQLIAAGVDTSSRFEDNQSEIDRAQANRIEAESALIRAQGEQSNVQYVASILIGVASAVLGSVISLIGQRWSKLRTYARKHRPGA